MSNDLINYEKYHAGRKPKQRRIMRTFKLSEISVVDRPAQAGARMTIMKRDEEGDNHERKPPMAREKQAGQFAYDDEDFDSLEFEHDRPPSKHNVEGSEDEDKKKHKKHLSDLAKGDFARLVDVLKEMQPGMTGCEALAKARRLAPNTVAKMNGEPGGPASYNTKEEAMVSLAKNEFHYTVDQISRRDKCDRATAMYKARREDPEGFAHAFGLDPADLPVAKSVASKDKENWELEVEGEKMRTKCSHGEAARRVARNRPDLRIGKGVTPRTNDLAGMRGADPTMADGTAKRDWMFAVAKIQDRDSCTYTEAMSKARKEYPSEFAAFQGIGGQQTRGGTV